MSFPHKKAKKPQQDEETVQILEVGAEGRFVADFIGSVKQLPAGLEELKSFDDQLEVRTDLKSN